MIEKVARSSRNTIHLNEHAGQVNHLVLLSLAQEVIFLFSGRLE